MITLWTRTGRARQGASGDDENRATRNRILAERFGRNGKVLGPTPFNIPSVADLS